jgi:hypothetical protein
MTQQHVHQQIPDYVLGLLPQNEQQQVDQHTLACPDCRVALRQERELTQLVRTTLAAAQPPTNLRQFMPPVPPKSRRIGLFDFSLNWPQQLAPLTLVLFLLLGSAGIYLSEQRGLWQNPTPTALAITATLTDSPTATITETRSEQALNLRTTAVPTTANQPNITATPAPNPTPIAALNVKRDA